MSHDGWHLFELLKNGSFANRSSSEDAKLNLLSTGTQETIITERGPQQICTGCNVTSLPPASLGADYTADPNTATPICSAGLRAA